MNRLIITEQDFHKVVPLWAKLTTYSYDSMTISHYGQIEYAYDNITDLPKYYRKLVEL